MLSVQDLTYRIGGRTLLDKVSVNIPAGHRVGLVGPNGTGKTTLFKIISGELQADSGEITLIRGASLGIVRQDLPDDDTTLIDIVLAADKERASLLAEAEIATDGDRIGYIFERLGEISAYDAPSRAASILSGLGFSEAAQNTAIREFSGGWRARVALAAVLFQQPNVLMLDEPTNHLDFESMVWLENFLMKYEHTIVLISHDRDILNKICDHILHLEDQKLVSYTGNYDDFERRRAERLMNQQALHEKQMAQKKKMMEFVDRFRAKASKAAQAQSRLKMIEKMDIVDAVMADRVTSFRFPAPEEIRSPLLTLDHVDIGYVVGKPILRNLSLRIDADDRIALLGANGNGKSTLVKLLSGRMEEMGGEVHRSNKLKVGYFAQFQTDELDVKLTPFEVMREAMRKSTEVQVRAALSKFGFDKDKADTKVGSLSGGEKARLLFCRMSFDAPHMMLLDEPTNHLDMDAKEALMQALNYYEGAVIIVSHDAHLVETVADVLWLVADGNVTPYAEDLDAYRQLVVKQRKNERSALKKEARAAKKGDTRGGANAEQTAKKLEQQIAELHAQRHALENDMATASERGDMKAVTQINRAYDAVQKQAAQAEAELEALIAAL